MQAQLDHAREIQRLKITEKLKTEMKQKMEKNKVQSSLGVSGSNYLLLQCII